MTGAVESLVDLACRSGESFAATAASVFDFTFSWRPFAVPPAGCRPGDGDHRRPAQRAPARAAAADAFPSKPYALPESRPARNGPRNRRLLPARYRTVNQDGSRDLPVRLRHLAVVERLVEDVVGDALGPRDLAQRPARGRRLLDDLGRLVVADERVERGRRGERQLGVALALLAVRLDAGDALLVEEAARRQRGA